MAQSRPSACRPAGLQAAIADAAQKGHARTALIDWRGDRPEVRNRTWFVDTIHYRQPIVRAMEADIAEALRRLR